MMNKPEPYGASPLQRQRELDAFEEQRQAYNTAMRDHREANLLDEASSPDRFNVSSMPVSSRFMANGGPVGKTAREQMDSLPGGRQITNFATGGAAYTADVIRDQILAARAGGGSEADIMAALGRYGVTAGQAAAALAPPASYTPAQVTQAIETSRAQGFSDADIATGLERYRVPVAQTAGAFTNAGTGVTNAGATGITNTGATTTGATTTGATTTGATTNQGNNGAQLAALAANAALNAGTTTGTGATGTAGLYQNIQNYANKITPAFVSNMGTSERPFKLEDVEARIRTDMANTGVTEADVRNATGKTVAQLASQGFPSVALTAIAPAPFVQTKATVLPSPATVLALPGAATNFTGSNLTGVQPASYSSILTSKPLIYNTSTRRGRTGTLGQTSAATDYTTRGVGTVGDASTLAAKGVSKPLFGQRPVRRGAAGNPNNYFAYAPETTTGLAPGTVALGPVDMPLAGGKTTLEALGSAPNLSPGMLGGQQNAGYRTDRLGNRIYSPASKPLYGFAKGGDIDLQALLAQNTETLSDDEPEESINTDPLGTAQKMMADFSSVSQTNPNVSPVRKAIKRTKPEPAKSGSAKMAYESLVKGDMGAMGTAAPALKDTDSAQAQMQELARIYRLKAQASQERARGFSADTFGAPTLEQPTLTKGKLTKKRFNKGGEAKKSGVVEDIGRWLKNNDINPSDFLAALGRTGFAAGTALSPSTLNEGEDAELARRRAMPPTVDRSKGSPEGGEAKKPEAEKTESSGFFSSIFKGNDENFIKDIKNKAEKNEDYRAMLEYLKSKDAVPDIKTGYLPEGFNAVFSARRMPFVGAIGRGTIKLNKDNLAGIGPSTMAHEMAHATDRQFEKQAGEQSGIFSKGNKFTDAYEKIVGSGGMRSGEKRTELARKLYPEWVLQNKEYRALPYEMAAHGVGNFAGPTPAEKAPPHVDATAATEFQILLDLARRNSNPPVKRAGGSTEEGETSIKDQLIGAGETALTLGSGALSSVVGMPYGLYKGLTSGKYLEGKAPAIAEKEAQAFIERNTYVPRSTKGRENLEAINSLMEQSKLPPILPETAMLRSIPRAAVAAQGERIGMATEKALEKPVTEVLKRGGKSAEMLKALSAPPSYVSRAPGGYFPTSRANEGGILSNLDKAFDPVLKEAKLIEDPEKREALSVLFNQKAKDFYTKQAGSIEDPLRKDILAGALKFERSTPMGDAFPQVLLKGAAQGDLESLRLLEKNYDQMIGIRSVVPRRTGTPAVEGVVRSQIMTNIRDNLDKIPDAQLVAYSGRKPGQGLTLDKIPDAQLVAYSGRKPGQGPAAVADLATEIRQKVKGDPTLFSTIAVADLAAQIRKKVKDNPTLFSTILEPRIAETLFNRSQDSTDVDIARFPSLYGTASTEAMVANPSVSAPAAYNDPMPPNYFLPELETAIEKGQPIQDLSSSSIKLLGMTPENMLEQARQMPAQDLNRMGFADFLKKAYVGTQKVDAFKAALPKVKKLIQDGKPPPADIMTYGVEDFLPTTNNFRWVKVVKPEAVRAIAVGMNNSVAGYATSDTYGSLRKGRTALNSGEAEVYALYDKNNVPHVTIEYLTNKAGVPDNQKNTIAQLTGNGPLSVNALPTDYAPQIVDFMNNVKPSSIPRKIKDLLEDTGQKKALSEEVLSSVYFGVPIEALRGGDDNLLQQLGAVVDNPPRQPGAVVNNPPRQPGAADNNVPARSLLRRVLGLPPRPPRRRPFI